MASGTPAVKGMKLYQATVNTEKESSIKPLGSDECIYLYLYSLTVLLK
jgi:hypothetical protein